MRPRYLSAIGLGLVLMEAAGLRRPGLRSAATDSDRSTSGKESCPRRFASAILPPQSVSAVDVSDDGRFVALGTMAFRHDRNFWLLSDGARSPRPLRRELGPAAVRPD
jgi:hypothetical protein